MFRNLRKEAFMLTSQSKSRLLQNSALFARKQSGGWQWQQGATISLPSLSKGNAHAWRNFEHSIGELSALTDGNIESANVSLIPYNYLNSTGGKNIRSSLASAFNNWFNVPDDVLQKVNEITNMVQVSSLLIDDIFDGSVTRRGKQTAHLKFGMPLTCISAIQAQFLALGKVLEMGNPKCVEIFKARILEVCRGTGVEVYCRETFQCPTEDIYTKIIMKKTIDLLLLPIQLLGEFSDNKTNFDHIVGLLATHYQIYNDLADIFQIKVKNTFCEDMTEGNFTFPVIHSINNHQSDGEILSILKKRTGDVEVKKHFVSLLEKHGSIEYTRQTLDRLEKNIMDEFELLGENLKLKLLLSNYFSNCNTTGDFSF